MKFDLITIGDSLIDTFFVLDEKNSGVTLDTKKKKLCFRYADKMAIEHSTLSVGGNAANVAIGASTLGIKTTIRTEVGDDITGQVILDTLKKAKVETKYSAARKGQESRYSVVLNYKSERTILSYHAKRNYTLPPLPSASWIYYTSLGKGFGKIQTKLSEYLRKHPECKLAMNPGSYQMKSGLSTIKKILPKVDLLLVNKEEAERLTEKKGSIKKLIKELHNIGPQIVVVTDSTNGSYASNGANIYHMPVYPIKPLAKTGAGDAYTSGFLAATIYGKTIPEAMQWGTANAGGVIKQFGAQKGLQKKAGVLRTVKKYPHVSPKKV